MSPWSPDEINRKAEEDFEAAWLETADLIPHDGSMLPSPGGRGKAHPMEVARQRIRKVLIGLGFDEVITPMIWEDEHVRRQYGPESALILDRCYYLAGLPRPEIGLSKKKMSQISRIVPDFDSFDRLTDLLRQYKAGRVESDDFVEEMVRRLGIPEEKATEIIDRVFSEMKRLHPVPTKLTILSHFTTAWFPILAEAINLKVEPIYLFTTGLRMRREQKEDPTHLRSHYNASVVVMAPRITLDDGRRLAKRILSRLGFRDIDFVTKKATSKYYCPGTEEEVFASLPSPEGETQIEIADLGMYSPVALSRYGIPHPVFNMGLSIGRLAMITEGVDDIRELTYPELNLQASFSDAEIEEALKPMATPGSRKGREISDGIVRVAEREADAVAPCSFTAWEGAILRRKVVVKLVEREKGVKLIGPAGFNVIAAHEGNITSSLPGDQEGPSEKLSYIRCLADYCAAGIEDDCRSGSVGTRTIRVGMVRGASDIFLEIPLAIRRYVESANKRIDIRGPMFTAVEYTIG